MKKLNITKKQYSESKYLQKKYGKLEYVSESGKIYKTSKGQLIKFVKESKLVKEGAGAGYDIEFNDLKIGNIKIIGSEKVFSNPKYGISEYDVEFEASIVKGEYEATAYGYYDTYFPMEYDDEASVVVDGGTIYGTVRLTHIKDDEVVDVDLVKEFMPSSISVKAQYGGGWMHQYLPENGKMSFNVSIDVDNAYITQVDIDSKNFAEYVNYGYDHRNDEEKDED